MADRQKSLLTRLQWVVVRTQKNSFLKPLLRWICRIGTRWVGWRLAKMTGIETVYVRHTHPREPCFVPGHSDIDLTIILSDEGARDQVIFESLAGWIEKRRFLYYYLSPEDVRYHSIDELRRLTAEATAAAELLCAPSDWLHLAGRDVRSAVAPPFPAEKMPWHPEFNRWWHHLLQQYLLTRMPGLENHYLRVFYRGTIKQGLHFKAAQGQADVKDFSFTDDALIEWLFDEDREMVDTLKSLADRSFWDDGDGHTKERLFWHLLRSADNFFGHYPSKPVLSRVSEPLRGDDGRHNPAYTSLEERLERIPELKSLLAGVIAYPTPHCHPRFYQTDMILPADISIDHLVEVVRRLFGEFGGREFEAGGQGFSITLVPEKIYQSGLFFFGLPYPFIAENIRRHGRVLFGPVPSIMKNSFSSKDLREWCLVFFPYFFLNLGRRVEHSSRTLNFCQLAAVRLFLETGEALTDALAVMSRHREVFSRESPDEAVWDYLFRDKPGRQEKNLYQAASRHLAAEIQRVEALIGAERKGEG